MKNILLITTLLLMNASHAQTEELTGTVYPIAERNLVEVIKEKLNKMDKVGEITQLQNKQEKAMNDYLHSPSRGKLPRASVTKSYILDPSYTTTRPITDLKSRVIFPVGYTVNPLEHVQLHEILVFINEGDDEQVSWIKNLIRTNKDLKIILTNGDPISLSRKLQKQVYFDQQAKLIEKFKVTGLPAIVSQEGNMLFVKEVAV